MNVTILQCVYDGDDPIHLEQSMMSVVANNSFSKVQWLLIVDGPVNDNIGNVILKFTTLPNLKVEYIDENIGLPSALNLGLSLISSEWTLRFDSDDLMEPTWICNILRYVDANMKEFLLTFDVREFNDTKNDKNKIKNVPNKAEPYIYFRNPVNHMAVLYHTEKAKKLGGYPCLKGFEDYGLWWSAYVNGMKMKFVNEWFVNARVGNNFHSRRSGLGYIRRNIEFEIYRLRLCKNYKQGIYLVMAALIRLSALIANNITRGKLTQYLRG